ncbi:hypothetical protein F4804DRAFT_336613 [Jackrogersella minutella]|nr:hypothetical protein F4804DRAFT_336613 [Jackrogersella minutella]
MNPIPTKKRKQGADDAIKSSVTTRNHRRCINSLDEVNAKSAKRSRLQQAGTKTPILEQQDTSVPSMIPSSNSQSSGRETVKTATTLSTVSTWLDSFDSDQESDSPAEYEELDLKSIDSSVESSDDEMVESAKSSSKTHRAVVSEPMFRKQMLEENNIWFRTEIDIGRELSIGRDKTLILFSLPSTSPSSPTLLTNKAVGNSSAMNPICVEDAPTASNDKQNFLPTPTRQLKQSALDEILPPISDSESEDEEDEDPIHMRGSKQRRVRFDN